MDVNQLIEAMTPEVYQRLNYAVETGRWPEGGFLDFRAARFLHAGGYVIPV